MVLTERAVHGVHLPGGTSMVGRSVVDETVENPVSPVRNPPHSCGGGCGHHVHNNHYLWINDTSVTTRYGHPRTSPPQEQPRREAPSCPTCPNPHRDREKSPKRIRRHGASNPFRSGGHLKKRDNDAQHPSHDHERQHPHDDGDPALREPPPRRGGLHRRRSRHPARPGHRLPCHAAFEHSQGSGPTSARPRLLHRAHTSRRTHLAPDRRIDSFHHHCGHGCQLLLLSRPSALSPRASPAIRLRTNVRYKDARPTPRRQE